MHGPIRIKNPVKFADLRTNREDVLTNVFADWILLGWFQWPGDLRSLGHQDCQFKHRSGRDYCPVVARIFPIGRLRIKKRTTRLCISSVQTVWNRGQLTSQFISYLALMKTRLWGQASPALHHYDSTSCIYRAFHNVLRDYKNLLYENRRTCIYETCTEIRNNSKHFFPR